MRLALPRIALWLSLLLVLYFAFAVFGPKFGWIDWQTGLGTLVRGWGTLLIALAALVALIALVAALMKSPRSGWFKALLALAIPAAFMGGLLQVRMTAESVPPIHDVTTDTNNPPTYSAATIDAREAFGANPVRDFDTPLGDYPDSPWAEGDAARRTAGELVADGYPDLSPLRLSLAPAAAAGAVREAMENEGLADVIVSDDQMQVEGVAETLLFGFKDDVVARVTPHGEGGSIVDFRSTSRVGLSDLGYNAARIRDLLAAVERVAAR